MSVTAIIHANIVQKDFYIPDGCILIEGGTIREFGPASHVEIPEGAKILDAAGRYAGPGLIDIHTHGAYFGDFDAMPLECAEEHLKHGTTSVYPAVYFSFTADEYVRVIRLLKDAMKDPRGKNIRGIYMEGPYLNPKYGASKENCPWAGPVRKEEYQPVIEEAKDVALVWALAPEREGILSYINDVRELCPDAVFSVAHSEAAPQTVEALMPYGLKIGTHHTDATGKYHKYPDPEILGVGVDEFVNRNRDIYAELIVDNRGIHVDPYMLRLIRQIKGEDRIILISDASASFGAVPEGYEEPLDICFDDTGEISGTKLTLEKACRNMMVHTGASIVDVFRYASTNPAAATGIRNRGQIAEGFDADLILTDPFMNVSLVMVKGEVCYESNY